MAHGTNIYTTHMVHCLLTLRVIDTLNVVPSNTILTTTQETISQRRSNIHEWADYITDCCIIHWRGRWPPPSQWLIIPPFLIFHICHQVIHCPTTCIEAEHVVLDTAINIQLSSHAPKRQNSSTGWLTDRWWEEQWLETAHWDLQEKWKGLHQSHGRYDYGITTLGMNTNVVLTRKKKSKKWVKT